MDAPCVLLEDGLVLAIARGGALESLTAKLAAEGFRRWGLAAVRSAPGETIDLYCVAAWVAGRLRERAGLALAERIVPAWRPRIALEKAAALVGEGVALEDFIVLGGEAIGRFADLAEELTAVLGHPAAGRESSFYSRGEATRVRGLPEGTRLWMQVNGHPLARSDQLVLREAPRLPRPIREAGLALVKAVPGGLHRSPVVKEELLEMVVARCKSAVGWEGKHLGRADSPSVRDTFLLVTL
jgi:hypothetical protein